MKKLPLDIHRNSSVKILGFDIQEVDELLEQNGL